MKAIVTGGCGFIGSHVVDQLIEKDINVVVVDNLSNGRVQNLKQYRSNGLLEIIQADIRERDRLQGLFNEADWVFHLAALADIVPSIQNPEAYFGSNVDGTFAVLEMAKKASVKRFVYTASSSCYGIPDAFPTTEEAEIRPEYPYALTKNLGEQMVLHWGKVYDLPVVSLRLFNVYGPRARTSGTYGAVFGVFLKQKIAGKPFTVVGVGTQTRDFTYVTDVANAFITAAESAISNEVFNVGSGGTYSINHLVELLGGDVVHIPKRPGEPDCTYADISKIRRILHWKPKVSFEEGVAKILDNIDYWKDAPLWTPEKIDTATKDWFKYLS